MHCENCGTLMRQDWTTCENCSAVREGGSGVVHRPSTGRSGGTNVGCLGQAFAIICATLFFVWLGNYTHRQDVVNPVPPPDVSSHQSAVAPPAVNNAERQEHLKMKRALATERAEKSRPKPLPKPIPLTQAGEILQSYTDNEVAADLRFKGKTVRVTGVVGSIGKDIADRIYVTVGTGEQFEHPIIQAFFSDAWTERAAKLHRGQNVTVMGRVEGLIIMNVVLQDSEIAQ